VSQASRLATFLGIAVAGSVVALIGSASTWTRVVEPAHELVTSLGSIKVPGTVHTYSAGDLGSPILPIALLCLVFSLMGFLVGPRARIVSTALLLAGGVALLVFTFTVPKPPSNVPGVRHSGPGRVVTSVGAAFVLAGATGALPLASRVQRIRMPESGPDEAGAV
jgi:hypothetical protein